MPNRIRKISNFRDTSVLKSEESVTSVTILRCLRDFDDVYRTVIHTFSNTVNIGGLRVDGHSSIRSYSSELGGSVLLDSVIVEGRNRNPFVESIINEIKAIVGPEFDGLCISRTRLVAIRDAVQACLPNDYDCLFDVAETYPEIEEALHQKRLDERFTTIRTLLHDSPQANITTEAGEYKTAIQDAFNVTFYNETGAQESGEPDRGFIALHLARLGLEATANSFDRWATAEATRRQSWSRSFSALLA